MLQPCDICFGTASMTCTSICGTVPLTYLVYTCTSQCVWAWFVIFDFFFIWFVWAFEAIWTPQGCVCALTTRAKQPATAGWHGTLVQKSTTLYISNCMLFKFSHFSLSCVSTYIVYKMVFDDIGRDYVIRFIYNTDYALLSQILPLRIP